MGWYRRFIRSRRPIRTITTPRTGIFDIQHSGCGKDGQQIKTDGLALGLKLPEPCATPWLVRHPFTGQAWGAKEALPLETVIDGRLPTGEPVAVAESAGIDQCPEVARVTRDPKMLLLAKRVLGYNPQNIEISLRWSFPTVCPWPSTAT